MAGRVFFIADQIYVRLLGQGFESFQFCHRFWIGGYLCSESFFEFLPGNLTGLVIGEEFF